MFFEPGCTTSLQHLTNLIDQFILGGDDTEQRLAQAEALCAQIDEVAFVGDLYDRANMVGHVTASAFIVNADWSRTLLIDHNALGRTIPPGGHCEPLDEEVEFIVRPEMDAQREAEEETGITGLVALLPGEPIDIDTHAIPPRPAKGEGTHFHHDLMFVFQADEGDLTAQTEEVACAAWTDCGAITDERTQRVWNRLCAMRSDGRL